ncbi:TPA: ATP-binding protein, partial [Bacillus thuringiensis]|nr:ATP-binding protein [Bacillus thuringiensis]
MKKLLKFTFILKPIISKIIGLLTTSFIEKWKIKYKLKKIKSFQKQFENTFVDSNTFQKFLNEEKNGLLIFNYVFGATYRTVTKDAFVEQLSQIAMNEINNYRKSVKLEEIETHPIVTQYLNELIVYLEGYRDKSFKVNEMSILANVQNSIVESNNSLKEYFEKNLYEIQQRAYLEKYTDEYLEQILDRNILDLGKRYNSEANVETDLNVVFDSLVSDKLIFEKFTVLINKFQDSIMNLNVVLDTYKEDIEFKNLSFIEEILNYLKNINYNDKGFYLENNLKSFKEEINSFMEEVEELRYKINEETKKNIRNEVINLINQITKHERAMNDYMYLIKPQLINNPYLLIYGDAGIGKSHLLADNAKRLQEVGHSVFLFLGQHLNTHDHPYKQLFDLIDYKGSKESFFKEFNDRAQKKNKQTVIIIDALNEGEGKHFWKSYLMNFLNFIKEFENIAVVLSVRSNYLRSILPENIEEDFPLYKLEHKGFNNLSLEALDPFFNFYKINPVIFPSLENECYNPLFLQIYCEAIQEEYVGFRGWSIVQVLEKYINKVNGRLSLDKRFSYVNSLNLVDKILKEIASEFIESERYDIELERLYEVIENVAKPYTIGYREILLGLAEENILSINERSYGESLVYFTYERFAGIYISLVLLERYQQDKNLFENILSSDNSFYYGVYESLSIIIPEKLKVEWLDLIDFERITFNIAEAFVRGISWRDVQNINDKTFEWVNLCLRQKDIDLQSLVYERLLKQSYIIESPLNAEFLHENLYKMSMPTRDGSWTISINGNSEVPTRLAEILLKQNLSFQHFEYGNFELLSTTFIWLFTCTDKKLRDISTTALIRIYMKEPSIILKDLKRFFDVNDPYVLERLLISLYGAILRINKVPQLVEIVDVIYTNIFLQDEVYPNVLIRDYARSIILFAVNKGVINLEKYEKINPPYSSSWYKKTYSLQEIDIKLKEMQQISGKGYCGFDSIIKSMTTEYGRGIGAYGDFGRYVFGREVYNWKDQFDDQDLSNIAIMRIIEYGYDEKVHGNYDKNLRYYNRHENLVERIGKKYQWIALYEILAKLKDNYPVNKEINEPWESSLRNIDPSLLDHPPEKNTRNLIKSYLPYKPNKIWAQNREEFKCLGNFIFIEYKGHRYISLAQLINQERDNGKNFIDRDEFFIKTKAVFLPLKDKENYIALKSMNKEDISVSWKNTYDIFAFEHYWHPAFSNMYYENEFENIKCEDSVWEYSWEANINSVSGEKTSCSYLLPNVDLVKFFELVQVSEGVWKDKTENMVVFDAQYLGYERNLLFRADYLEEYLELNKLAIVWDFYMEKISERSRKEEWFVGWINEK